MFIVCVTPFFIITSSPACGLYLAVVPDGGKPKRHIIKMENLQIKILGPVVQS